jgi:hypothetical protein
MNHFDVNLDTRGSHMATSNYKEEKCNFAMNPEDGAYL